MAQKHTCNKEKELGEIQTDIKWIKKDISEIRRCLAGNGQRGITQRIQGLENWRWYAIGIFSTIVAIATVIISLGVR